MQNYNLLMEKTLEKVKQEPKKPTLLLHACCGPCLSHVLHLLKDYFSITVYYYNPCIYPNEEYLKRLVEVKKLCSIYSVSLLEGEYNPTEFYSLVKGREEDKEGGDRCKICLAMRIDNTGKIAKENSFDYFTTTLSISPLKDANYLNTVGISLQEKYGVNYLVSDFKKKDGYLNSIKLSKEYGLYRQNYCGCEFSLTERS